MPGIFGSGPPNAGLATWIGWSLRAGADRIGSEVEYLVQRARTSTKSERSAWLYRFVIACAMVVGECLVLNWLSFRPDSLVTLITTWSVLFPEQRSGEADRFASCVGRKRSRQAWSKASSF